MLNRLSARLVAVVALLALMLAACGGGESGEGGSAPEEEPATEQEPVTIRVVSAIPLDNPNVQMIVRAGEEVTERTDGAVVFDVFTGEAFGDQRENVEAVELGTFDGALSAAGVVGASVPVLQTLELPFLFRDNEHAITAFTEYLPGRLQEDFSEAGFALLAFSSVGFRDLTTTNEPVRHPDDLSGIRIRVPEIPAIRVTFEELGAVPVTMAGSEVLVALRTGAIEAQDNNPWAYNAMGLHDAGPAFYTPLGYTFTAEVVILGLPVWEKLTAEQRDIVMDAFSKSSRTQFEEHQGVIDSIRDDYVENGDLVIVEDVDLEAFRERAEVARQRLLDEGEVYVDGDLVTEIEDL
jgi:TRAP-type C4-dicarboxylate transport system substrate-binding protein